MEIVGQQEIQSFLDDTPQVSTTSCPAIRRSRGHLVVNFMDLATKVAELQFRNRDYVMLFRGQAHDHKNTKNCTTLKPSIMRAGVGNKVPNVNTLIDRFNRLRSAEIFLSEEYSVRNLLGRERLKRQQILRWSVLQHYEICLTPLLDVTHSIRIAASFASMGSNGESYIFVLAVPHISGAITASAEAGLQIVRLASVCPPSAVRPHIQEGYLLGEYPELSSAEQKQNYAHFEVDFGRRLIAKFRFRPLTFWQKSAAFPQVPEKALYPRGSSDPMCDLASAVTRRLGP